MTRIIRESPCPVCGGDYCVEPHEECGLAHCVQAACPAEDCPTCEGTGVDDAEEDDCPTCDGRGKVVPE